mmetsp:Transcript_10970/g.25716  ORF Transcript_10970/g.25716 Transcript_10970/m.25716 type:complete len:213 (+) Transcript_10970:514-1152(+)
MKLTTPSSLSITLEGLKSPCPITTLSIGSVASSAAASLNSRSSSSTVKGGGSSSGLLAMCWTIFAVLVQRMGSELLARAKGPHSATGVLCSAANLTAIASPSCRGPPPVSSAPEPGASSSGAENPGILAWGGRRSCQLRSASSTLEAPSRSSGWPPSLLACSLSTGKRSSSKSTLACASTSLLPTVSSSAGPTLKRLRGAALSGLSLGGAPP